MAVIEKSKTPKTKTPKTTFPTGPKKSKKSKIRKVTKSTSTKKENSNSPKKRNGKKCILYGIPIFIIFALVAALIVVFTLGNVNFGKDKEEVKEVDKKEVEVCKTPECIILAHHLHNWNDDSVDPCKDFFKYSCGKYNEHNTVEYSQMSKKTEILKGLIKEFLKKNESSSSKTENTMKHLFRTCEESKDESIKDKIEKERIEVIKQEAMNIGWPLADPTWRESSFDLAELLEQIPTILDGERNEIGYGIFNIWTPSARKIFIGTTTESFTDFGTVKRNILQVLGKDAPSNLDNIVKEINEFSKELRAIHASIPLSDDPNQKYSNNFEEINDALPVFDYLIKSLLSKGSRSWGKVKNKIYGYNSFLSKIEKIRDLVYKDKRITANYLVYKYVSNLLRFTPGYVECHQVVIDNLPLPSLRVFIRNHFDKGALKDVDNLVEDIRSSFIEMLEKSEWIREKTRIGAIRKAKAMKKTISYPPELEKPGALDKHFNIQLDPSDSYYLTMRKIDKASMNLLMDYVSSDFPMGPHFTLSSNAVYSYFGNSINIYAPLMDDPLFHSSFPNYAKIAGIGIIIGHEIGHGYDIFGINFDENGIFKPWFDAADQKEYENKAACLTNQYNNYDDHSFGKKLNGTFTVKEMMADELGQDVAWRTFKKLDLSQEKKIIGFEDDSIEKLYFQIGATTWCSPRSPLTLQQQLMRSHPTYSFRVNGLFANEKAFAETFNCPAGSPMNPVKKCTMF
ncbi:hypothetical protein B9Z55_007215 [Caenorhabditis nigoni]|uniref:Peptidase M13 C-terminal domain-containing protein n=1 Tax=Caenorhabditis nigoni TaxID=1611254 RepID=A0A2G5V8P7_9PELO|nr:hypothetical protein B9Z55_007215 [Caenorhabditis nigoni]